MLIGLDWCRTCALGLEIWKKWKTKRELWNGPPLTLLIPSLPQTSWTSQPAKLGRFKGEAEVNSELTVMVPWSSTLSPSPPFFFLLLLLPSFFLCFFSFWGCNYMLQLLLLFSCSLLPLAIASTKEANTAWEQGKVGGITQWLRAASAPTSSLCFIDFPNELLFKNNCSNFFNQMTIGAY
jgi:hypothetical protein